MKGGDRAEDKARATVQNLVSAPAFKALETFLGCLVKWSAKTNLVSAADQGRLWQRHVLDSLQLVALAQGAGPRWIDLGSGAGFPGLVVAIARNAEEGGPVTLVEANRKKAAFLAAAIAETGARASVRPIRAESLPQEAYDVVSARALAPLPTLLSLARRFCGPSTLGLYPKGREADAEVTAARERYAFDLTRHPSSSDPEATILAVRALAMRTGAGDAHAT